MAFWPIKRHIREVENLKVFEIVGNLNALRIYVEQVGLSCVTSHAV